MNTAARMKRVVIRQQGTELVGSIDIELLGPGERICPASLEVKHPAGDDYEPAKLEVGEIVLGDSAPPALLPRQDVLVDVVRGWLTRAMADSIFRFASTSTVFRIQGCSFERPVVYVMPAATSARASGF